MDNVTLNNITESCQKYLLHAFVSNGLQELMIIARYCTDKQLISQVEELAENYHCMLSFLASGGKDEPAVFVKAFEGIHELPAE